MRDLSITQILAGALAAASAAVASSWLGVAGTVLGAVVVSIVASVASALYAHPIERSSRVLLESIPVRDRIPRLASEDSPTEVLLAQSETARPETVRPESAEPATAARPQRKVHWGAVAVSAAASLVLGFALLTGLETVMGKPVTAVTDSDPQTRTTVLRIIEHTTSSSADTSDPGTEAPDPASVEPTTPAQTPAPTEPTQPTQQPDPTQQPQPTEQPEPTQPTQTVPPADTSSTAPERAGDTTADEPTTQPIPPHGQ